MKCFQVGSSIFITHAKSKRREPRAHSLFDNPDNYSNSMQRFIFVFSKQDFLFLQLIPVTHQLGMDSTALDGNTVYLVCENQM
jgi:hypothetical protein